MSDATERSLKKKVGEEVDDKLRFYTVLPDSINSPYVVSSGSTPFEIAAEQIEIAAEQMSEGWCLWSDSLLSIAESKSLKIEDKIYLPLSAVEPTSDIEKKILDDAATQLDTENRDVTPTGDEGKVFSFLIQNSNGLSPEEMRELGDTLNQIERTDACIGEKQAVTAQIKADTRQILAELGEVASRL